MNCSKLTFILIFFLTTEVRASSFEADFLDYMMEYYQKSSLSGAMVQEKSENLDLKRISRKFMRDENRDIKKMKSWRSGYFEEVPNRSYWPGSTLPEELQFSESEEFDSRYIDYMISLLRTKKRVMQKATNKITKDFLLEFIKHEIKEVEKNILKLKKLRSEL